MTDMTHTEQMQTLWSAISTYMADAQILCKPIPLSACTVRMPRLLERSGLPVTDGTVFMMAVPYVVTREINDPLRNVSLYAVPRDYHLFFKELELHLLSLLTQSFPLCRAAVFADHSPIDEIAAATCAGLGDKGRNGLLLTAEYGSFVFLGELIVDIPFDVAVGTSYVPQAAPSLCTGCDLCAAACPIGCRADRKGCLSALTQQKGSLNMDEKERLVNHPLVWGCDTCQTVCPVNRRVLAEGRDTVVPFFLKDRLPNVTADTVRNMSDEAFSARAYAWRKRDTIARNLSIQSNAKKGGST